MSTMVDDSKATRTGVLPSVKTEAIKTVSNPPIDDSTVSSKPKPSMSRAEVLQLAHPEEFCLIIVGDRIYDCTKWQYNHPGGHLTIRALCGKDGTDAFDFTHPKYVSQNLLSKFFYAHLKPEDSVKDDEATIAFRDLTKKIEQADLFETDYTFYYNKMAVFIAMFLFVMAGVLLSDRLLVHALAGILLGMFWQQMAFIGHDLGHNSITHNRTIDSYLGLFVGNFCTGISIGWWKRSHNVHHIVTNSCEHDPDIQHLPIFAIDRLFLKTKVFSTFYNRFLPEPGHGHVLVHYQHWLYYPIMSVARFNLYVQSLTHALGVGAYNWKERLWNRNLQIATLLGFWTWLITLTMQLPTWKSRVTFFMLAHMVAGILHVQITLSHFPMPTYSGVTYDKPANGFLRTQLAGSLNIDCSPWMDWFHGGLQFQVEHHLWPRLPRHNLRLIKPLLLEFCLAHGLQYHQATFFEANYIMLCKLKEMAKTATSFSEFFNH